MRELKEMCILLTKSQLHQQEYQSERPKPEHLGSLLGVYVYPRVFIRFDMVRVRLRSKLSLLAVRKIYPLEIQM